MQDLIEGGRPKEDLDVLVALRDIFEAFSKPLNVVGDLTQSGTPAPSAEGDCTLCFSQVPSIAVSCTCRNVELHIYR